MDADIVTSTPITGLSVARISEKLHELIVIQKADNETVFDWIDSNVNDASTKQPEFIRILITAVCYSALTGGTLFSIQQMSAPHFAIV